ncbi:MAG TPA: hypothetical protein VGQ22_15080 [Steroidobacteraceae bacterium]|jgi:RNA polymerase-binding transcription factor DksA|nr:hypothetical protein [Steroidobacteraceae bacterium]
MSAPQLDQVKQLLTTRRNALEERHARVARDLQRRNDPLVADWSDRAIQLQNDEALQAIDDAAQDELAAIDEALRSPARSDLCPVRDKLKLIAHLGA